MNLNNKITQRQFYLVIFMLIVWLSFSVGVFIYFKKECKMADENPLTYIREKYDLDYCYCQRNDGDSFYFDESVIRIHKRSSLLDIPDFKEEET